MKCLGNVAIVWKPRIKASSEDVCKAAGLAERLESAGSGGCGPGRPARRNAGELMGLRMGEVFAPRVVFSAPEGDILRSPRAGGRVCR